DAHRGAVAHVPRVDRSPGDPLRPYVRRRRERAVALHRRARRCRGAPGAARPDARGRRHRRQPPRALGLPVLGGGLRAARALHGGGRPARHAVRRVRARPARPMVARVRRARARPRRARRAAHRGAARAGAQQRVRGQAAGALRRRARPQPARLAAVVPAGDARLVRRRISAPGPRAPPHGSARLVGLAPAPRVRAPRQALAFLAANAALVALALYAGTRPWIGELDSEVAASLAGRWLPFALVLATALTAALAAHVPAASRGRVLARHFLFYLTVPATLLVLRVSARPLNAELGYVYLLFAAALALHALAALWSAARALSARCSRSSSTSSRATLTSTGAPHFWESRSSRSRIRCSRTRRRCTRSSRWRSRSSSRRASSVADRWPRGATSPSRASRSAPCRGSRRARGSSRSG